MRRLKLGTPRLARNRGRSKMRPNTEAFSEDLLRLAGTFDGSWRKVRLRCTACNSSDTWIVQDRGALLGFIMKRMGRTSIQCRACGHICYRQIKREALNVPRTRPNDLRYIDRDLHELSKNAEPQLVVDANGSLRYAWVPREPSVVVIQGPQRRQLVSCLTH